MKNEIKLIFAEMFFFSSSFLFKVRPAQHSALFKTKKLEAVFIFQKKKCQICLQICYGRQVMIPCRHGEQEHLLLLA
jgi:hypothetical protein